MTPPRERLGDTRVTHRGPGYALEVVRVVATEDGDDVNGYLVVAAVSKM